MFTAFEPFGEQREYRFKSIDALVQRLGGDHYQVSHEEITDPPRRTVLVLKYVRSVGGSKHITTLRVPSEALKGEDISDLEV